MSAILDQWSQFVSELDGAITGLLSAARTACDTDRQDMHWEEEMLCAWLNLVQVNSGFSVSTVRVDRSFGYGAWTDHMKAQVEAAHNQMKGVYDEKFGPYRNTPATLYARSQDWEELVPKLQTADEGLRNSKTSQNWSGEGAQAYFETLPKQMSAIADMATMANTAAGNLDYSAQVMAAQYEWILASIEQMQNAIDDVENEGSSYVRSTSLVYWMLGFGKLLQDVAGAYSQQWNSDMYTPVEAMGDYLSTNQELKQANKWPVAANVDGDFTPTAPNPGGMPPGATPYPSTPAPTAPMPPPASSMPYGPDGGPLDLDLAEDHRDSASVGSGGNTYGPSDGAGSSSRF